MATNKKRDLRHTPAFLAAMNDQQLASMADLKPEQIAAVVFLRRQKLQFQELCDRIIFVQKRIKNVGLILLGCAGLLPIIRIGLPTPPQHFMYSLEVLMMASGCTLFLCFMRREISFGICLFSMCCFSVFLWHIGKNDIPNAPDPLPLAWLGCMLAAIPAYFFGPKASLGWSPPR